MKKIIFALLAIFALACCTLNNEKVRVERPSFLQPGDTVGLMVVSSPVNHPPEKPTP